MVEVSEDVFSDQVKDLEKLAGKLSQDILSALNIRARVKLVEPKSIARSEGKAVRVIDKRKLHQ